MKIEKVTTEHNTLGEAGFWDVTSQTLTWVDVRDKTVLKYSALDASVSRQITDEPVSIAIKRSVQPGYLIAQRNRLDFLSDNGQQTPFVSEHSLNLGSGIQLNDGKCDPKGRLWIGTIKPDLTKSIGEWPAEGSLYTVTAGASVTRHNVTMKCSNGMDWTTDNRTFLFTDTADCVVYAFDFELETGQISRRRTALSWPQGQGNNGRPDGMTLDVNDKLWVALVFGSAVAQYDLETGKELQRINFSPTTNITCCNFGGQGLDELYVTSGTFNLTPDQRQGQPDAGALYRVTGLGARGRAPYTFAG